MDCKLNHQAVSLSKPTSENHFQAKNIKVNCSASIIKRNKGNAHQEKTMRQRFLDPWLRTSRSPMFLPAYGLLILQHKVYAQNIIAITRTRLITFFNLQNLQLFWNCKYWTSDDHTSQGVMNQDYSYLSL